MSWIKKIDCYTFLRFIRFLGAWHQLVWQLGHLTQPAWNLSIDIDLKKKDLIKWINNYERDNDFSYGIC